MAHRTQYPIEVCGLACSDYWGWCPREPTYFSDVLRRSVSRSLSQGSNNRNYADKYKPYADRVGYDAGPDNDYDAEGNADNTSQQSAYFRCFHVTSFFSPSCFWEKSLPFGQCCVNACDKRLTSKRQSPRLATFVVSKRILWKLRRFCG
jgi:hypothetical protein